MRRFIFLALILFVGVFFAAVVGLGTLEAETNSTSQKTAGEATSSLEVATFGSGCFWCTESDFDKVKGVTSTVSGYMGGKSSNPTYKSVSSGRTGHAEVLQVTYDPKKVSFDQLLYYYWRHADIVDGRGQFCDRGSQYRPVIFAHSKEQKKKAIEEKAALDKSGRFSQPIAVEIADAGPFTRAEEYHQDYYLKNPARYKRYRTGCGRDQRLRQLWGKSATH